MRISGLETKNLTNQTNSALQQLDSFSKKIQEQIMKAQERLRNLSSNEEMSIDEKLKKRQEIQKQITDLNNQLRQYQFEQERKKQQEKRLAKEQSNKVKKEIIGSKEKELSQESMNTLISADSAVGQIKIQENIKKRMKTKANSLQTEISLEESRAVKGLSANVEKKKEELQEIEQKEIKVSRAMRETIGKVNDLLESSNKNAMDENFDGDVGQKREEEQEKAIDLGKKSEQKDLDKTSKVSEKLNRKSIDVSL